MKYLSKQKYSIASITKFVACVVVILTVQLNQVSAQNLQGKNHEVSVDTAFHFIKNFQNHPTAPNIKSGLFSRTIFDKILSQPGCAGIRYYYAVKDDNSHTLVVVGVDTNGADLSNGVVGETIWPCPPFCDTNSPLNH